MKQFVKFTVAIIMGIVALGFQSCGSDDDEPDVKIKVTQSEIQGSWHTSNYGMYHRFKFSGSEYSYSRMDARTNQIEYMENGSYNIVGYDITFHSKSGSSQIGGTGECEIYWESNLKNQLHIYPLGTYTKSE